MSAFRLVVERGRSKGRFLRLKPNQSATVGRVAQNGLAIQDPQASRQHFKVEGKLGEFVLTDLESSNGTFVNGERCQRRTLSAGDRIAIGESLVCFLPETDEDRSARRGPLSDQELGGYRVGRVLGRGGMGTVYEAVQLSLERTVALKVLPPELTREPELVERFVSEARAAGRLNNAHLVGVFDVAEIEGHHLISMELMPGGSLEDLVRAEGKLSLERSLPLIFDAARGLEYAAKQQLVHRDVKPANLMIAADGTVKLCDLGLAIFTARQHDVSGSPHYIAPEQALGKDLDGRADLYALGATWFELLSGETLYEGRSAGEIARKQVEEPIGDLAARLPDAPADVIELLGRLLEKDPAERYPSARQLQADLALLAQRHGSPELAAKLERLAPPLEPLLAPLPEAPALADPEVRRRLVPWAVAAVGALLLLGGVGLAVGKVRAAAAAKRAAAEERLAGLVALRADEPAKAEAEVDDTIRALEGEGYPDLAAEATELKAEMAAARKEEEREEQERIAQSRLEAIQTLAAGVSGPDPDPAADLGLRRARVEEALRLIGELVQRYPETEAALGAQRARGPLVEALDRIATAERARQARKDAARDALDALRARLDALLQRPAPGAYAEAFQAVDAYVEAHGATETKAGPALRSKVQSELIKAVGAAVAMARRLAAQEAWGEARQVLAPLAPPLGNAELEAKVRATLAEIEDTRRAALAAAEEREIRLAKAQVSDAMRTARPALEGRRYGEAARPLRRALPKIERTDLRRLTELRAARLEGAQRALERLLAHVEGGEAPKLWLTLEVAGKERRAYAAGVDRLRRVVTFAVTAQILRDVPLLELSADDLLGLSEPLAKTGRARVDLACLAYELGQGMRAEQLLVLASGQAPQLAAEVEGLRVLAGAGQ